MGGGQSAPPLSSAGLPEKSAWVSVGPPLFDSGASAGLVFRRSPVQSWFVQLAPEVGWSDFPVAILGAWLPAFRRLAARGQAAECYFMDGPYHFTITAAIRGDWTIACFEHREGPKASNERRRNLMRPPARQRGRTGLEPG